MDLVEEIKMNPEKGAERLVAEYRDRLVAAAFKLCRDEHLAEDLAFATIEKAVARISDCEGEAVLFSWMYVILLNLFRNSIRRRSAKDVIISEELAKDASVADERAAAPGQGLDDAALRDAVNSLPRDMRDAVVMHYFMDIPLADIARTLKAPLGTVKSRLHYGRLALAEILKRTGRSPIVRAVAMLLVVVCGAFWFFGRKAPAVSEGTECELSPDLRIVYQASELARLREVTAVVDSQTVRFTVDAVREEDGVFLNDGRVAVALFEGGSFELLQIEGDIWGRASVAADRASVKLSKPVFGAAVEAPLMVARQKGGVE